MKPLKTLNECDGMKFENMVYGLWPGRAILLVFEEAVCLMVRKLDTPDDGYNTNWKCCMNRSILLRHIEACYLISNGVFTVDELESVELEIIEQNNKIERRDKLKLFEKLKLELGM